MAKPKTLRGKVRALWRKIPEAYRVEIISVTQTFIAVFGATLVMFVQSNMSNALTAEAITSLIVAAFVAAARAGVKAVWVAFAAWVTSRAAAKK